jgi:signal transduction histidine kinase
VTWQTAGELPETLAGDAGRVRQVLVNLLGNAVKFTERGHIAVKVCPYRDAAPGSFILFSVEDTGVGIGADHLQRIFGKFTQVETPLTKRQGGTGLGLALSRQIVEKMGGRIWVESEPGAGSTFFFTLPCTPGSA